MNQNTKNMIKRIRANTSEENKWRIKVLDTCKRDDEGFIGIVQTEYVGSASEFFICEVDIIERMTEQNFDDALREGFHENCSYGYAPKDESQ